MVERVDYLSKVQYAERKMIDDPRGGQLMEKFSEIVYTRPDAKAAEASARQYLEHLKQAKSYEEMKQLFTEHVKENEMWSGMQTVAISAIPLIQGMNFMRKKCSFSMK